MVYKWIIIGILQSIDYGSIIHKSVYYIQYMHKSFSISIRKCKASLKNKNSEYESGNIVGNAWF